MSRQIRSRRRRTPAGDSERPRKNSRRIRRERTGRRPGLGRRSLLLCGGSPVVRLEREGEEPVEVDVLGHEQGEAAVRVVVGDGLVREPLPLVEVGEEAVDCGGVLEEAVDCLLYTSDAADE